MLLQAYEGEIPGDFSEEIEAVFQERPFLADRIKRHLSSKNPLFAQPSIVLVYLMAARQLRKAQDLWPLTHGEMEPLLNDLGESWN